MVTINSCRKKVVPNRMGNLSSFLLCTSYSSTTNSEKQFFSKQEMFWKDFHKWDYTPLLYQREHEIWNHQLVKRFLVRPYWMLLHSVFRRFPGSENLICSDVEEVVRSNNLVPNALVDYNCNKVSDCFQMSDWVAAAAAVVASHAAWECDTHVSGFRCACNRSRWFVCHRAYLCLCLGGGILFQSIAHCICHKIFRRRVQFSKDSNQILLDIFPTFK